MIRKDYPNKILVIRNDKIGDMVLSSSIFRSIKISFPNAIITVVASKSNKELIEKNKNIDRIYSLDSTPRKFYDFLRYFRLAKIFRKEHYDIGIDLRGSFFNTFLLLLLGKVKYKIGFYEQYLSKFLLNYAYKRNKHKHEGFLIIDLINKSLGLKLKNYYPEISTDKNDRQKFKEFLSKNKIKKYICINPDASTEYKQWPIDRFDTIISYLESNYPSYKIILVGANKQKLNYLIERHTKALSLINENLRLVYLLLKDSSLVIAQDGGCMHLAWASKAKLIAIMEKHLPIEHIRPLDKNSIIIMDYMDKIKVEQVINKIDKIL